MFVVTHGLPGGTSGRSESSISRIAAVPSTSVPVDRILSMLLTLPPPRFVQIAPLRFPQGSPEGVDYGTQRELLTFHRYVTWSVYVQRNFAPTSTVSGRGAVADRCFHASFHNNPHAVPLSPHSLAVLASPPDGATWTAGQVVGTSQVSDVSSLLGVDLQNGHPAARDVGFHPVAHVHRRFEVHLPVPGANGSPLQ